MTETATAYQKKRSLVAVGESGSTADGVADRYIDEGKSVKAVGSGGSTEAMKKALDPAEDLR